jgi:hypothetical protein
MTELCFQPLGRDDAASGGIIVRTGLGRGPSGTAEMWLGNDHRLETTPSDSGATLVAVAKAQVSSDTSWWLAMRSRHLMINGLRPLSLTILQPGDLLSIEDRQWLVVAEWTPEPQQAPAGVADRPCPVCAGALGLAQVVQCPCGRYTHLEKPAEPGDPNALNCFLAARCSVCEREPTLEPRLIPQPHEKLIAIDEELH